MAQTTMTGAERGELEREAAEARERLAGKLREGKRKGEHMVGRVRGNMPSSASVAMVALGVTATALVVGRLRQRRRSPLQRVARRTVLALLGLRTVRELLR